MKVSGEMDKSKTEDLDLKRDLEKIVNSNYFANLKNKTQLISFNNRVTDRFTHSNMVFATTKIIQKCEILTERFKEDRI